MRYYEWGIGVHDQSVGVIIFVSRSLCSSDLMGDKRNSKGGLRSIAVMSCISTDQMTWTKEGVPSPVANPLKTLRLQEGEFSRHDGNSLTRVKVWLEASTVPGAPLEIIDSYIAYSCSG